MAGTASAIEFNIIGGSEQSSDIFLSTYNNSNTQFRDGDGVASGANPAVGPLGVAEPTTLGSVSPIPPSLVADVDGIDLRPVAGAAFGTNIYFAYDQTTINTGAFGPVTSAADIFVNPLLSGYDAQVANTSGNPPAAQLYINENQIGFGAFLFNDIDALVIFDNGNGTYDPGTDVIVFSLAPGSGFLGQTDSLLGLAVTPGDILVDGLTAQNLGAGSATVGILHTAESLGLRTVRGLFGGNDNLNALDIVPGRPASPGLWSAC